MKPIKTIYLILILSLAWPSAVVIAHSTPCSDGFQACEDAGGGDECWAALDACMCARYRHCL